MQKKLLRLLFLGSSLLFITSCVSTSRQLVGTTWVGDYERYEAKQEQVPGLLEHGVICLTFDKDSLKHCNIEQSTDKPPRPCHYFHLKYKQDSIFFIDKKQKLILKKRTEDCLELEHVERKVLYYLKPYKGEQF